MAQFTADNEGSNTKVSIKKYPPSQDLYHLLLLQVEKRKDKGDGATNIKYPLNCWKTGKLTRRIDTIL